MKFVDQLISSLGLKYPLPTLPHTSVLSFPHSICPAQHLPAPVVVGWDVASVEQHIFPFILLSGYHKVLYCTFLTSSAGTATTVLALVIDRFGLPVCLLPSSGDDQGN